MIVYWKQLNAKRFINHYNRAINNWRDLVLARLQKKETRKTTREVKSNQMNAILYAFYFALHFAMIFLGFVIALYTDMTWLGLGLSFVIAIKFMLMLPDLNERTDI